MRRGFARTGGAISRRLGIPISYVGTGEKVSDFAGPAWAGAPNHEAFVDSLFFENGAGER